MNPVAQNLSRRQLLKTSAAFGAFAMLPGGVALGETAPAAKLPPSEMINLAVIGVGNQGANGVANMAKTGLCNIVALCDANRLEVHGGFSTQHHPDAKPFIDFRVMFDTMADDIDAVVIATPDHSHFCAAMLAMSLGKPVYVEKPLAHTFGQCARLMAMAEKTGLPTQMGNQGASGGNYFQFKTWAEAGVIKDITRITAHMCGERRHTGWGSTVTEYPSEPVPANLDWDQWIDSAVEHPFSRKLHPQEWRSWYDYGSGALGDWGPHILDTCHQFLDLGLPETISAVYRDGVNPLVFPQATTLRFNVPQRGDKPPCEITWYEGVGNSPEVELEYGPLVKDPETGITARQPLNLSNPGKILYSKDLVFMGGHHWQVMSILPREKYLDMRQSLPRFPQKNSNHYENFLLACKGEEEARAPFAISGRLVQFLDLGVISQRLGGTLHFDRERKEFTNNQVANALLDPPPRKGWEEFYRL